MYACILKRADVTAPVVPRQRGLDRDARQGAVLGLDAAPDRAESTDLVGKRLRETRRCGAKPARLAGDFRGVTSGRICGLIGVVVRDSRNGCSGCGGDGRCC
jgi:hypothetical protein